MVSISQASCFAGRSSPRRLTRSMILKIRWTLLNLVPVGGQPAGKLPDPLPDCLGFINQSPYPLPGRVKLPSSPRRNSESPAVECKAILEISVNFPTLLEKTPFDTCPLWGRFLPWRL